ncbi:MAG: SusC/RagA family TonB-linked outer membrane protein [Proteiniphilum sp.]
MIAQTVRVTGKVTDHASEPLPGVTVLEKGTANGTSTDIDGNFSITASGINSVLVFSFVGFDAQEIRVGDQTVIDVQLAESAQTLDDVVIVAFGAQKKSEVVGAVTTIKPEELKTPSSNLTTSLAGRLAGVISYQRSGEPGADNAEFFIRGVTTFGYKQDPLILIDGIELGTTDLARLSPDDIASFSIMKDATATALYGARGANGVILVTTKEGREGKAVVSVRMEGSLSKPTRNIELADPVTYMRLNNEAILTRDPLGRLLYSDDKIDNTVPGSGSYIYPATDWREEVMRDYALNQRMNMSVRGGG